jgi:steroid 5-alpha reductase family enzyme
MYYYFLGLGLIVILMTMMWLLSIKLKNASIVDIFWGMGFICLNFFWLSFYPDFSLRKIIISTLVSIWGMRLSLHILIKNWGQEEDFRYQNFRQSYGVHRYWWFSFFQVFLLQGVILWIVALPLFAIHSLNSTQELTIFDFVGMSIWLIGFIFEAGGDYQLKKFKQNPKNKGKVLNTGFWKYTRHPNYFGDSFIWWGFAIISLSTNFHWGLLSAVLMNFLLVKISGVAMIERSLKKQKPAYNDYCKSTSSFIPWFSKK